MMTLKKGQHVPLGGGVASIFSEGARGACEKKKEGKKAVHFPFSLFFFFFFFFFHSI
jgi:hypothetical protein